MGYAGSTAGINRRLTRPSHNLNKKGRPGHASQPAFCFANFATPRYLRFPLPFSESGRQSFISAAHASFTVPPIVRVEPALIESPSFLNTANLLSLRYRAF